MSKPTDWVRSTAQDSPVSPGNSLTFSRPNERTDSTRVDMSLERKSFAPAAGRPWEQRRSGGSHSLTQAASAKWRTTARAPHNQEIKVQSPRSDVDKRWCDESSVPKHSHRAQPRSARDNHRVKINTAIFFSALVWSRVCGERGTRFAIHHDQRAEAEAPNLRGLCSTLVRGRETPELLQHDAFACKRRKNVCLVVEKWVDGRVAPI